MKILGYEFSDIQRAQQGGRLSRPIDTRTPAATSVSEEDLALLRQHGSIDALQTAGMHGVVDRLQRAQSAVESPASSLTHTSAFRQWFGNSKIVDPLGNPLMVYHGTDQSFSTFSLDKRGSNTGFDNAKLGFFFIADKTLAENFARDTCGAENIIQAYLSITKPLDLTVQGVFNNADQAPTLWEIFTGDTLVPEEALRAINDEIGLGEFPDIMEAIVNLATDQILERDGFDGIISDFGGGHLEYVAFRSDQIMTLNAKDHQIFTVSNAEEDDNLTSCACRPKP